jgi:hypothetical protein
VEGFPTVDEDNVTCVDLWLKCAFWSQILSKIQHLLEFNVGGKRAVLKKIFSAAMLDASGVVGATDLFSIWIGTLSTACLQPKLLGEIGFWSFHKALHSPSILECMPSKKYAFLTQCFLQMRTLRGVDAAHLRSTGHLQEVGGPVAGANPCTSSSGNSNDNSKGSGRLALPRSATQEQSTEGGGDVSSVDWQLYTLYTFSVVCAAQWIDLRPGEKGDVKEKQINPLLEMCHRYLPFVLPIPIPL